MPQTAHSAEPRSARRITYRGRQIDCVEHTCKHELRIDGVAVPVFALGPDQFSTWALPGGRYPTLEALGRAVTRAYFGTPLRELEEEDPETDSFELPED